MHYPRQHHHYSKLSNSARTSLTYSEKASVLLATSVVFVSTGSPVPYFDYTSPAPRFLLIISLMLAMTTMLTSGSSLIRWLHADRQWTQDVSFILAILIAPADLI
jgi:hypothetical protein